MCPTPQVLQALSARRPEVRQVRGARPVHAAPVARVLRVHAAAAAPVLSALDGRGRVEKPARPEQSGHRVVHHQRVLGPRLFWQKCAHAKRPQAGPHLARSHISGTRLIPFYSTLSLFLSLTHAIRVT